MILKCLFSLAITIPLIAVFANVNNGRAIDVTYKYSDDIDSKNDIFSHSKLGLTVQSNKHDYINDLKSDDKGMLKEELEYLLTTILDPKVSKTLKIKFDNASPHRTLHDTYSQNPVRLLGLKIRDIDLLDLMQSSALRRKRLRGRKKSKHPITKKNKKLFFAAVISGLARFSKFLFQGTKAIISKTPSVVSKVKPSKIINPSNVKPNLKPNIKPNPKPNIKPNSKPNIKPNQKPNTKPNKKPNKNGKNKGNKKSKDKNKNNKEKDNDNDFDIDDDSNDAEFDGHDADNDEEPEGRY